MTNQLIIYRLLIDFIAVIDVIDKLCLEYTAEDNIIKWQFKAFNSKICCVFLAT